MNIKINNSDKRNITIKAIIEKQDIEEEIEIGAKELSKTVNIDGFRKGKVPISIVKQRFQEELVKEAENRIIQNVMNKGSKDAKIDPEQIIGDPTFQKFDKDDKGEIDLELIISLYPIIPTIEYSKIIPTYNINEIEEKKIQERLDGLVEAQAPLIDLKEERALENGDTSIIDFIGRVNGEKFEGGEAEDFKLKIGSKHFIPGFEEQMIGMKKGETKDIFISFPKDYPSDELKGKDSTFTVTLNKIMVKDIPIFNDDIAKKLLPDVIDATEDIVKEKIKNAIKNEEIAYLYKNELKEKMLKNISETFSFELPINILNQEIDSILNNRTKKFNKNEIKEYQEDKDKLLKLNEEVRAEAKEKILIFFILESLIKKENIKISDKEIKDIINYEAQINGRDPEQEYKRFKDNNLLSMIKMELSIDSLFYKILGIK